MTQNLRYRAYETEIVRPFETFDSLLDNCKLMVSHEEGFTGSQNIILDEGRDCIHLALKFAKHHYQKKLLKTLCLKLQVFFKDLQAQRI